MIELINASGGPVSIHRMEERTIRLVNERARVTPITKELKMRNRFDGLAGCGLGIFAIAVVSGVLFILMEVFAYNVYRLTGIDIPWYGDLAGAVFLNCLNVPVALVLWICELAGYLPTPIFG